MEYSVAGWPCYYLFCYQRFPNYLSVNMNEIGKTNDVASVVIFITMTILTIVLAGLSYKFFEMPFLRLKSKFSVVQSTNSKE